MKAVCLGESHCRLTVFAFPQFISERLQRGVERGLLALVELHGSDPFMSGGAGRGMIPGSSVLRVADVRAVRGGRFFGFVVLYAMENTEG